MTRMFLFLLLSSLSLVLPSPLAPGQWRAAVYEHVLTSPAMLGCSQTVCSREEAVLVLQTNLATLLPQVEEAAGQGAQLILLPEDGIHGYGFTRDTIPGFLEPLLPELFSPCELQNTAWHLEYYVQTELSCAAISSSMWVAATLGTIVPDGCTECGEEHGPDCYYNTLVVYDPRGRLVGSYHKYNLWTSELAIYDIDPAPRVVVLDTELGRLGLAICEDLLWRKPVVELAEDLAMDTLLLPLSWWDMFPHQLAHSSEDAWARGLQTNLLAANTHYPAGWTSGSGIFSPSGHAAVYHNVTEGSGGRLLVADLDIHPTRSFVNWNMYANEHVDEYPDAEDVFTAVVYNDTFRFIPMEPRSSSAKVCTEDGSLCCLADFTYHQREDVFSLGVFSGRHTEDGSVAGSFYIELCTVMKCDPQNVEETCQQYQLQDQEDYNFLVTSNTVFQQLRLSGTFSDGTRVFPEVLFSEATLRPEQVEITPEGSLQLRDTPADPVLSLSLFGRRFSDDAPNPEQFCPGVQK